MRRAMWRGIGGVLVAGACIGTAAGGVAATTPSPVDEFVVWAMANGYGITSAACSDEPEPVCYALDLGSQTIAARRTGPGEFTPVLPDDKGAEPVTVVDPTGDIGTRTNPVPLGTPADVGEGWTLTVNSVDLDANAEVAAANSFNEPPPTGTVYVMINATLAYDGPEDKAYPLFLFSGVTSSNREIRQSDAIVVAPDDLLIAGEVFSGGEVSGNAVLAVPTDELSSLVVYTSAGFSLDDVYFASA